MPKSAKAILFMLASALSFTLMGLFVKSLDEVNIVLKIFFRNAVILLITGIPMLIQVVRKKEPWSILTGRKGARLLLFFRSMLGFLGVISFFYAISHLSLGESSSLNRLSPFFVLAFAAIFLNEKIQAHHILITCVGFLGAVLILKPGVSPNIIPAAAGLASAAFAGGAYTIIRGLKDKAAPQTIVFWFGMLSALGTIPLATLFHPEYQFTIDLPVRMFGDFSQLLHNLFVQTPQHLPALLAIGVFAGLGQIFLTNAYQLEKAGDISIYNYTHILFALGLDLIVWQEIPDVWSLLGAGCILLAGILMYAMGRNRRAKQ